MKVSGVRALINVCLFLGMALSMCRPGHAIPAFARKYGMPCSACHEAWPKLNNFGQVFKDNGYQMMNERDAPIYQHPAYFPISFRMTPQWHRESTNLVAVDSVTGDATSPLTETKVTASGFDLSGVDLWTAGTLANNISFLVLPSADETGAFHFEAAWVRFDNLFKSRWVNFKFGKHELDTPISEKRFLTLTANGGFYQLYHYIPPETDINSFGGLGDNQLGAELMGHSANSYTRYAVSVLSSNDGNSDLPTSSTYDVYGDFSQAFEVPRLGLQRVGVYGYDGRSPTYYLTAGGQAIPGTGQGKRSFYRAGAYGIWYAGKLDVSTLFMHGKDNVFLGTGTATNLALPDGAAAPTWNGGFAEAHLTLSPQLILVGRYETVRMSQQALPVGSQLPNGTTVTSNFGNTDAWLAGYRFYPIMNARAGLALHMEYAHVRTSGVSPVTGQDLRSNSFMLGFDFAF